MTSPDRLYRTSPDRLYPTSPTGLPGVGLFAARVEPTDTGSQPLPGVLLGHEAFAGTSTSLVELLTPPDGLPSLPAGRRRRRTRVGFSLMAALTLVAMGVITETSPLITLPWLPHSSATAGTGSWPSPLTGSVARASGLGWASTGASGTGSADPAATDPDPSDTSVPEPETSDGTAAQLPSPQAARESATAAATGSAAAASPTTSSTPPTAAPVPATPAPASPGPTVPVTAAPGLPGLPGAVPAPAGYGSTVDEPAPAPAPFLPPGTLPVRPEGRAVTATGNFRAPFPGSVGARWLLTGRGDEVTLTGQGYVQVRWAATYARGTGPLQLPVWSGLQGKLFHVASGGGHRLDDGVPGATDLPHTWLGNPSTGYDTLPPGAAPPWHVEYYYLDGSVTLTNLEDAAGYDLGVGPRTRAQVLTDLNTAPGRSVVRFGLVRDNGTDTAPVPQYLTRSTIGTVEGLLAVPQHSAV